MERIKLLLAIVLLLAVMVAAVIFGSSWDQPMDAYKEIEEIWAIEDTRQESETPLLTYLENNGAALGYDAASNTFYCPLGMENGEEWPQLRLTAPDAPKGIQLCFADDYTYDNCRDAIADGTPYQAMAWTQTEYSYFDIVFTGLPVVCITAQEEIWLEDVKAEIAINSGSGAGVSTHAKIHVRGGGSRLYEKKSYKVKFTRGNGSKKRNIQDVPFLGELDSILLNAAWVDSSMLRDRLTWQLYDELIPDAAPFTARKTGYAEVFLNDEYIGAYLLMEPMKLDDEMAKAGVGGDAVYAVYRTRAALDIIYSDNADLFDEERTTLDNPLNEFSRFEYRYGVSANPFAALADYLKMDSAADPETFMKMANDLLDVDSLLRYDLLMQGCGLTDNVYNNLYIWAHYKNGGMRYRFAPWDLDLSWALNRDEIGWGFDNWVGFPLCDRLLMLSSSARIRMQELWQEMRAGAMNEAHILDIAQRLTEELTQSGAWQREAERWDRDAEALENGIIEEYVSVRLPLLDSVIEQMAADSEGGADFLAAEQYGDKGIPMPQLERE